MTELFSSLCPLVDQPRSGELPMYKDVLWDHVHDIPVFRDGAPVIVQGRDAVQSWCRRALIVPRYRLEMYTKDYGSEMESLIGQPYTDALKQAEAIRYVQEALQINPYVTNVTEISVEFDGGDLRISCTVNTIYGGVDIHV